MSIEPLPACILQLLLLILCGVMTVMTASLGDISIAALRRAADDDKDCRRLLKVKEGEDLFTAAYRFWSLLIYLTVGALAMSYLPAVRKSGGAIGVIGAMLALAFAAVVISRLTPVRIAEKNHEEIASASARVMGFFSALSRPAAFLAMWASRLCAVLFGVGYDEDLTDVTEDEIRMMVDIGTESGAIAPQEQEFIQNIFEFDNMSAADVMTHRTDVAALRLGDDPREWEKTVRDCGFSRFPVCGETIDDIVGVVHARELYEFLYDASASVREIIRPAYVVPETVPTDILFRNMQKEKSHMAIVVDEYGGFSGIVTMDDLLEELVGHINDEKEELVQEEPIVKIDEGTWEIDGTAPLEDVSSELGVALPTREYDTIGGLIFAQMDKIPEDGSAFEIEAYGLNMKVVKIEDRRIEKVLVCVAEPAKELDGVDEEEQS